MDLEPTHHLLLFRQLAHELCHVFQLHIRGVCLTCVNDALDLAVNIIKGLQEVHIT